MKDCFTNMKMFLISIVIFLLVLGFCGYVVFKYQEPLDMKANKNAVNIEVSLPVLEWTKFTGLSKDIAVADPGQVLGIKKVRNPLSTQKGTEQLIYIK